MSETRANSIYRRIDEELVCVDSMKHVLCTRCGCIEVGIRREKNDPPDFTVTIDGERFAAEVTSIVLYQQYYAHCREFAKVIRDRTRASGVLSGTYVFNISRVPRIPKPTSREGRELLQKAITFVENTSQQTEPVKTQLVADESGEINLERLSPTGSAVRTGWLPTPMWEGEIQNECAALIQQRVDDKRRRLIGAGVSGSNAILLLYDVYSYADPQDAVAALQRVKGYDWFHSIFWAASFFDRENTTYPREPGREGIFLYSNKEEWNKVGTAPMETGA